MSAGSSRFSSSNDYVLVFNWMWAKQGLALKPGSVELMLFARVHGVTRDRIGEFFELQEDTARFFGISRESINRCYKSLIAKDCIVEVGERKFKNGRIAKIYSTHTATVAKAIARYSESHEKFSTKREQTLCDEMPQREQTLCDESLQEQTFCDKTSHGANILRTQSSPNALNRENRAIFTPENGADSPCDKTSHVTDRHTIKQIKEIDISINQSSGSSTSKSPVASTLSPEQEIAFRALCEKSLKAVSASSEDETRAAYAAALAKGYTPDQVAAAYDKYVARYRETNPQTPRFAKKLCNWLASSDGFFWDAPRRLNKQMPKRAQSSDDRQKAMKGRLAEIDPTYAQMVEEVGRIGLDLCKAKYTHLGGEAQIREQYEAQRERCEAYFRAHEQEVLR